MCRPVVAKDCFGEGTGWGTIQDVTLRVLLLVAPDRTAEGQRLRRAIHPRHTVTVLDGRAGFAASLTAARAAHAIRPHLVHACGSTGFAKAAGAVAAGIGVPYVLSLSPDEIAEQPRRARSLAARASAVILSDIGPADVLRKLGVERELYVVADTDDDDDYVLGAHEIVYGRVVGAMETSLEDAAPYPADLKPEIIDHDGVALVQIGSAALGRQKQES